MYFMLAVLCLSSVIVSGQKLELKKASPFTAVKWEKEQPVVQFEDVWYHFEKLDGFNKKEILDFCKKQFGHKWQKRFSEDLVEVLHGLGSKPNVKVELQLSKNGVSKTYTGTFTLENRQSSLLYNRSIEDSKPVDTSPQKISSAEAIEDLKQFEQILNSTSSYTQLSRFDYKSTIRKLSAYIANKSNDVNIDELANQIGKIMSEMGDRHSSIKNESFNKKRHGTYNLRLPFGVTSIDEQIVATKQNINDKNNTYYDSSYPHIKSVNGVPVETLIDSFSYKSKKAPKQSKIARGSRAIQKYGKLLFENNMKCPDSVVVVFSDGGKNEKKEKFKLTTEKNGYAPKLLQEHYVNMMKVGNGDFGGLSKTLEGNIGYINIPRMYHYDEVEGLEDFMENTLKSFLVTKALIIDIRNNPGGGREILQTFARYILQPAQSPWVANVAYLRTNKNIIGDEESMSGRYLYSYESEKLTNDDRRAIDQFNESFKLQKTFDSSKFSAPFYMVLNNGNERYAKPVYILVNEKSFSAATVFTSAFKSLPNVKIVGETTDGSSGNSRKLHLKNSNIRVKVSTMLSFQRNGKTLDGNGTIPDILISEDEEQVLKGVDSQLNKLIERINGDK